MQNSGPMMGAGAPTGGKTTPDWMTKFNAGADAGGLFGGLFGGSNWRNPSEAANPYMNQIPGILKQYMSPYVNMGLQTLPELQKQYSGLLNDPTAMMNKIGAGFQKSPGYQFDVNEMTRGANQAAAAGGMVGSPAEQAALAQQIGGYANQNYNNYVNMGLGQYGMGLQGMGGLNQMGFNAASGLSSDLANVLMNQAQLAYSGQNSQNQYNAGQGAGWGSLFGGGASFLPWK